MDVMRVLACALGASLVTSCTPRPDDNAVGAEILMEDLRNLQGMWEHTFKDRDGNPVRKVKDLKANTERVTWYAADGAILLVNTVEFRLGMKGNEKVFTYFNGMVVDGPPKGTPFESGSYSYTLEGDEWTEIMTSGEKFVWKRVKVGEK